MVDIDEQSADKEQSQAAQPNASGDQPAPEASTTEEIVDLATLPQSAENEEQSEAPQQTEMPFAMVQGTPVTQLPQDLYIPPDALEVFLEAFEGPLDLLLYLIKRQNLDIVDIPIADITAQYVQYVEMMHELQLELAAEYLVMAAMLAEIKSRMLLPRPEQEDEEDEGDPRAELIRRLQEYERYKQAAEDIDTLPRMGRDTYNTHLKVDHTVNAEPPEVSMQEIMLAMKDVMSRAEMFTHHNVEKEKLSVRERMTLVLERLSGDVFTEFSSLFTYEEGRGGVVVSLLAILELSKLRMLELVQNEPYGPIHVRALDGALEGGIEGALATDLDAV